MRVKRGWVNEPQARVKEAPLLMLDNLRALNFRFRRSSRRRRCPNFDALTNILTEQLSATGRELQRRQLLGQLSNLVWNQRAMG